MAQQSGAGARRGHDLGRPGGDGDTAASALEELVLASPAILFRGRMPDLALTYVTPNLHPILGYRPREVLGVPSWWPRLTHPGERAGLIARAARVREQRVPVFDAEHRLRCRDGSYRWFHTVVRYERDESGTATGYVGSALDVTEVREARERLHEVEARYRTLIERLPAITFIDELDPKTRTMRPVYVSPRVETLLGCPPAEWLAMPIAGWDLLYPEDRERIAGEIERTLARGKPLDTEYRMVTRDGRVRWFHESSAVCPAAVDGAPYYIQGLLLDITERKLLEERMQRQNDELAALHETALGLLERRDTDGLLEAIVARACALLDTPHGYLGTVEAEAGCIRAQVGSGLFAQLVGDCIRPGEGVVGRVWVRGAPLALADYQAWKGRLRRLDHVPIRAVAAVPIRAGGEVVGILGLAFAEPERRFGPDEMALLERFGRLASLALENARLYGAAGRELEQRRRSEEALSEAETKYRTLVERLPGIVYDVALAERPEDERWVYVSSQVETILGFSRAAWLAEGGRLFLEQLHPDDRERYLQTEAEARETGRPVATEYRMWTRDGQLVWIRDEAVALRNEGGAARSLQGIMYDVTERRGLEEELHRARTLETVGRLAGGIAHDFNNLLTAISGYAQLLALDLGDDDPRRTDAEAIQEAARRASTLTAQLLAFARRQVLQPRIVDLNAVVAETEPLLRPLIPASVRFVVTADPAAGRVHADPTQLQQVIINLALNARDAMADGGTLTIRTAAARLNARRARAEGVAAGRYATLAVADTGTGMDEVVQSRLFEPFFTTKRPGHGTGLGLATVHGVVSQSGGRVTVSSAPGTGTTFTVWLPQVGGEAEVHRAPEEVPAAAGSETVLVVEDEAAVRRLVAQALRRSGYTVLTAADGAEALRIIVERAEPIDLVVSDVVMPGMGGGELGERLAEKSPATKILYTSGYTDDERIRESIRARGAAFIGKPFSPNALTHAVRAVLDGKPPAAATDAAEPPAAEPPAAGDAGEA